MRPAITGDARALREALEDIWRSASPGGPLAFIPGLGDELRRAVNAIDLPEPTAKAEEEPDYTCPACGKDSRTERCKCARFESVWTANRRIAQLTRERDEVRGGSLTLRHALSEAIRQRDSARAQAIQDTKDAAEQMFLRYGYVGHAHSIRNLEVK